MSRVKVWREHTKEAQTLRRKMIFSKTKLNNLNSSKRTFDTTITREAMLKKLLKQGTEKLPFQTGNLDPYIVTHYLKIFEEKEVIMHIPLYKSLGNDFLLCP